MGGMDAGNTAPRVLVVDDDSDVLASLERGLRLSGFDVSTAVDGAEALRSATETRPDAIVLDINMPVLDGVSVVTALRAMDNDVPVCVLSARSSVDDRVAGGGGGGGRDPRRTAGEAPAVRARPGCGAWKRVPTTPWSSRSCWPSWSHGSRRCCDAEAPPRRRRRRPSRWGRSRGTSPAGAPGEKA